MLGAESRTNVNAQRLSFAKLNPQSQLTVAFPAIRCRGRSHTPRRPVPASSAARFQPRICCWFLFIVESIRERPLRDDAVANPRSPRRSHRLGKLDKLRSGVLNAQCLVYHVSRGRRCSAELPWSSWERLSDDCLRQLPSTWMNASRVCTRKNSLPNQSSRQYAQKRRSC